MRPQENCSILVLNHIDILSKLLHKIKSVGAGKKARRPEGWQAGRPGSQEVRKLESREVRRLESKIVSVVSVSVRKDRTGQKARRPGSQEAGRRSGSC